MWSLDDGREMAVLRGHTGRGVWRIAVAGDCVATAGADASIKLWSLSQSCSGTSKGVTAAAAAPTASLGAAASTPGLALGSSVPSALSRQTESGGQQDADAESDGVFNLEHCPCPGWDDDAPKDASGATPAAHHALV